MIYVHTYIQIYIVIMNRFVINKDITVNSPKSIKIVRQNVVSTPLPLLEYLASDILDRFGLKPQVFIPYLRCGFYTNHVD